MHGNERRLLGFFVLPFQQQAVGLVDGVVLVYQVGRIGRSALKRAKFLVDHAQGKVLGTVLTNVRAEITPEYGYYRYEYR